MSDVAFLVGQVVKEVRYHGIVRIIFDEGERVEPALYVDLEEAFTYVDPAGSRHEIVPSEPESVGPVLAIHGCTVHAVDVDSSAALDVTFSDGSAIRCEPHERHEAWQVVGGSPQYLVVSVGPDDLAVWDKRTPGVDL
jgi:hypothetical protein